MLFRSLQIVGSLGIDLCHEGFGCADRVGNGCAREIRAALNDRAMEETLGRRHGEQGADFARAAGLTVDRDIVGVAAEVRDVVLDPLQRGDTIGDAYVGGFRESAAFIGEIQESEGIEAVIDGDLDDVVLPRQVCAIVDGVAAVTAGEATTVKPHHDGALALQAVGPDVESQAIFA